MNFLAHFHLADHTQTSIPGALLGDHVKGNNWQDYPADLRTGIKLHRFIDSYTDEQINLSGIKKLYPESLRRFAPIALDIMLDHCLALSWHDWHPQPLPLFARRCYRQLEESRAFMPPPIHQLSQRMSEQDWLTSYRRQDKIELAIVKVGQRFKKPQDFSVLATHSTALRNEINQVFGQLYPKLLNYSYAWPHSPL